MVTVISPFDRLQRADRRNCWFDGRYSVYNVLYNVTYVLMCLNGKKKIV